MRGWAAGSSPAGFAHERNICTRSKRPPAADGAAGALLLPLGPGPGRPARPAPAPGGPGPGRPGNCPPHPPHPARGPVRAGPAVSPVRGPGGRTALHGEGGNELVVMRAQSAPARPVGGLPIAGFYARHKAGLRVFCATTMRSAPRRCYPWTSSWTVGIRESACRTTRILLRKIGRWRNLRCVAKSDFIVLFCLIKVKKKIDSHLLRRSYAKHAPHKRAKHGPYKPALRSALYKS